MGKRDGMYRVRKGVGEEENEWLVNVLPSELAMELGNKQCLAIHWKDNDK
jgi:hypothetical protein